MNYADLCTTLQNTTENTFSAAQLAVFFKQAEQKIYGSVQLPSLRKNAVGAVTIGNPYLSLPTDFLSAFSVAVILATGEYVFLLNKDVNFLRMAYPNPTTSGPPRFYALFGSTPGTVDGLSCILGPTPDAAYNVELHYNYLPVSIVTAGNTWLGDNFDGALLNGALVEAIRFMKGDVDMIKLYNDMFTQSIALLKNLGDGKMRQDAFRSGQTRVQVS